MTFEETNKLVDSNYISNIFNLYKEINEQLRHFNRLQIGYRVLASSWLLATLTGVTITFTKLSIIGIDQSLLAILITFVGIFGIFLVWLLAVAVYHDLLISCFVEGEVLEKKFTWLPHFCENYKTLNKKRLSVRTFISFFYVSSILFLLCIASLILMHHGVRPLTFHIFLFIIELLFTVALVIFIFCHIKTSTTRKTDLENSREAELSQHRWALFFRCL